MSAPTKKQLAANHRRRLRTMRKQLLDMSAAWEDVDQFCAEELKALADKAEDTAVAMLDDELGATR